MLMPGRKYTATNSSYRYGFNGKENDNEAKGEGNQLDYGMRIYDPRVGKFLSVDPLTGQYAMLTPYQFSSNNPIHNIDIDGLEGVGYEANLDRWTTELSNKQITPQQFENRKMAVAVGGSVGVGAGLVILDNVYAGGRVTQFLYASIILGHLYHNGTNNPAESRKRGNDLTNDVIGLGGGFIFGEVVGSTISIFRGPVKEEVHYLFRGTTEGFEGSNASQQIPITPTSSDPGVATIFSIAASKNGKGIFQIALPSDLGNVTYSTNVLQTMEKEIGVGIKPADFTTKTKITITTDQARSILNVFHIKLPSKITLGDISNLLKSTPRLSQEQISEFYKRAAAITPVKH
jgi:RHS repeat-associated protein